jgi:2-polyprenyl-6-methoxyphenol hydroxylase-like FAD-dependent oxidoreductase
MGTGFAVVAAYVLAGELDRADGNHTIAFPRYEATLRDYALSGQKGGSRAGPFLAPRTRAGITLRNRALGTRFLLNALIKGSRKVTNLALPDLSSATTGGRPPDSICQLRPY